MCCKRTHGVCPGDLEPFGEVVESVRFGTDGVLGARYLGEQARRPIHAQLADVHVGFARAHRPALPHTTVT